MLFDDVTTGTTATTDARTTIVATATYRNWYSHEVLLLLIACHFVSAYDHQLLLRFIPSHINGLSSGHTEASHAT